MALVYVGLGSNVGSRREHLARAIAHLADLGRVGPVSSLWRTAPRDRVDQADFMNAVAAVTAARWILEPAALLGALKEIERAIGRTERGRFGPREIDLDILLFSAMPAVVRLGSLEVPHPRLRERRFALEPLAELAPDERDPASGRTVRELLADVRDQEAERLAGGAWWTGA